MPDTNDKIKALYNAASQKFDIGTEQDFRQKLTDPAKRKAFYDAASADFDLGTYDEYEKKLGPNQKQIDEGKAMAAKVPSFKDFAAERGAYTPRPGEIQIPSDVVERVPSLSRKAEIAKDVQEAPERIKVREEKKEKAKVDALKNNTIKALTASGTKFTEGDAVYKKMQESIKSVVEKGAMTLSADTAGNPVYKRSAGIVESFINNFEASRKDIKDSEVFRKSSDTESVKIAEEIIKGIEQEAVPSGAAAEISGMFGSAAPLLGRAVIGGGAAAKFLPGPAKIITALGSFGATISPSYDQAYKQGAVELYAKGIDEIKRQKRLKGESDELSQQEKEEAMRMAKNEASVSGFAEGIFTAGLSSIPLGSSVAGQSFKKAMVNFAKNTAKEVPRNVTLGAASEVIKDVSARNAGYNITTAETLNNVLERSGQDLVTTLAFEVGFNVGDVANVPKYVKAAANNYLSTIPTLEFNNFAKELEGRGVVEPGFAEKAAANLGKFNESKSRVPSFIPEADMPSFAGLIEKKTNLENQKKSTDPAFHAKIDEQITAVDARIKKMQESPNPIFDEVDELTGDTGDATPITETEIEKSIEYADGFAPETSVSEMADGEKKLFSETDRKGRVLTFFSNTKEKDGKITTTFLFNRSDKDSSQRNNAITGIPVEKALGDKYTINEDYIPLGAKVVGVSEIRITEKGAAATVTLENEGAVYKAEVQLNSNTTYGAELKALESAKEPTLEIERLRAEEQKELESAIPNIKEYKVNGVVDETKITDAEEKKKFNEIYSKYDKLITPLLKTSKVAEAPVFKIDGEDKFFHASPNKITGPLKKSTAKGFGTGIYFSTNKELVKSEFGENVTEVLLNIENPVYTNTKEWSDVQSLAIKLADADYGKKKGLTLEEGETFHRYDSENLSEIDEIPSEFISKAAQELGHDAIIDKGSAAYDNEILVLDESKIQYKESAEEKPIAAEQDVVASERTTFVPIEGFDAFEIKTKEGKKERYVNPDKVLASSTIKQKTRAEQEAIIDQIGDPMDARQAAMIALMGKPRISHKSFENETGLKGTVKTKRGIQTEAAASIFTVENGGNTIERVAEGVYEDMSEEQQGRMSVQDIRNEIIDLIPSYKDTDKLREDYINDYSPKEMTDEQAMNFYLRNAEEIQPIEKELDDWAMERGEKEIELELDENYVDKLIEQYESTKKDTEPAGRKKEGVAEEASGTYAAKEKGVIEGGDVKKYIDEQATEAESTDFDGFARKELKRDGFEAEYKSARVEGETKEQYLIRKYCK